MAPFFSKKHTHFCVKKHPLTCKHIWREIQNPIYQKLERFWIFSFANHHSPLSSGSQDCEKVGHWQWGEHAVGGPRSGMSWMATVDGLHQNFRYTHQLRLEGRWSYDFFWRVKTDLESRWLALFFFLKDLGWWWWLWWGGCWWWSWYVMVSQNSRSFFDGKIQMGHTHSRFKTWPSPRPHLAIFTELGT